MTGQALHEKLLQRVATCCNETQRHTHNPLHGDEMDSLQSEALCGPDDAALQLLELTAPAPSVSAYIEMRRAAEVADAAERQARKTAPKRAASRSASEKALQRRARAQEAYDTTRKANYAAHEALRVAHEAMGRDVLSGLLRPLLESVLLGGLPAGRWVRTGHSTLGMRRRYEAGERCADVNFFAEFDPYGLPEKISLSRTTVACASDADDAQYAATLKYPSMWDRLYTLRATDKWEERHKKWTLDSHVGHGWDAQDAAVLALIQADVSQVAAHLEGMRMPTYSAIDMAVHALGDVVAGTVTYSARGRWLQQFEEAFPAAKELVETWLRANGIPTSSP